MSGNKEYGGNVTYDWQKTRRNGNILCRNLVLVTRLICLPETRWIEETVACKRWVLARLAFVLKMSEM
jgi:hypothetical protein